MHFVVDKDVFLRTLQRALAIMDVSLELPVFQSIRVDVRAEGTWLSSSSPGISCAIRMPLKSQEGVGVILLPAKRVLEVVQVLKGDARVSETEADLVIASGRSRFTVKRFKDVGSFDPAVPPEEGVYAAFDAKRFAHTVKKISAGVSIKEDKPQTQVVHIGQRHLVVTDLSYLAVATNDHFVVAEPINLNRGLIQAALKSLGESGTKIALLPDRVVMVGDDSCVQVNLSAVQYPSYESVYGMFLSGVEASFQRDSIVAALDEAMIASEADHVVCVQVTPEGAFVSAQGSKGSASSVAECEYTGPKITTFVDAMRMSRGLKQFTAKTVRAKILDHMKPIMFYEDGYEFYAAPCRDPRGASR